MKLDYFLYMSEAEGVTDWVNTRESRINAVIERFCELAKQGLDIDNKYLQDEILKEFNLEDITPKESIKIATKVNQKVGGIFV